MTDLIARGLNSAPTINNLTCIISAEHWRPRHGDPGAGWRLREGIHPVINDSLRDQLVRVERRQTTPTITTACVSTTLKRQAAALSPVTLQLNSVDLCLSGKLERQRSSARSRASRTGLTSAAGNQFATVTDGTALNATAMADDADLQLLEGYTTCIFNRPWATSLIDNAAPLATTTPSSTVTYLGGVSLATADWISRRGLTASLKTTNRQVNLYGSNNETPSKRETQ